MIKIINKMLKYVLQDDDDDDDDNDNVGKK